MARVRVVVYLEPGVAANLVGSARLQSRSVSQVAALILGGALAGRDEPAVTERELGERNLGRSGLAVELHGGALTEREAVGDRAESGAAPSQGEPEQASRSVSAPSAFRPDPKPGTAK